MKIEKSRVRFIQLEFGQISSETKSVFEVNIESGQVGAEMGLGL